MSLVQKREKLAERESGGQPVVSQSQKLNPQGLMEERKQWDSRLLLEMKIGTRGVELGEKKGRRRRKYR